MTKSLNPFLSELVWSINWWPELSAKKDCPSLSPASNLSQKIPLTSIDTHFLQPRTRVLLLPPSSSYCLWYLMLVLISPVSLPFFCFSQNPPFSCISYLLFTLPNSPLPLPLYLCHVPSCLLVPWPVILTRECVICIIWISLVCRPDGDGEGSLSLASLMVESALQEKQQLYWPWVPWRYGWSILKIDFSCSSPIYTVRKLHNIITFPGANSSSRSETHCFCTVNTRPLDTGPIPDWPLGSSLKVQWLALVENTHKHMNTHTLRNTHPVAHHRTRQTWTHYFKGHR